MGFNSGFKGLRMQSYEDRVNGNFKYSYYFNENNIIINNNYDTELTAILWLFDSDFIGQ
jgi:hypothetical protein